MFGINWSELLDTIVLKSGNWFLTSGIRIILYVVAGIVIVKVVRKLGKSIVSRFEDEDETTRNERERRADTLFTVVNITTKVFVWVVVVFMVLKEIGANITPLLTGAGVAGLAIGFGAQNIVRDFLNGFLILLENQYRVGDVVNIAGKAGLVESINLRTTIIRDLEGVLHIIPNGEIKTVDNMTFSESRALIDVGISYNSSVDKAFEVIKSIGGELKSDESLGGFVRDFNILGVENLGDSSVDLRVLIKTDPLQQWAIARRFKYLVKKRFDEAGIEIPYPHQTVYLRSEKTPEKP